MLINFCDSNYRDGFGSALLHHRLNALGHQVLTIPFYHSNILHSHMFDDVLDGVILNHMSGRRNNAIARHARSLGSKVFVVQTEGIPYNKELHEWFEPQVNQVDAWFSWYDNFHEDAIPTGSPRFEIHSDRFKELIWTKEYAINALGLGDEYILLCTSWPNAKFLTFNTSKHEEDWDDHGISGARERSYLEYEQRKAFMSAVSLFRSKNPDVPMVLKPHPMERIGHGELVYSFWEQFCSENDIILVQNETIENVLAGAKTIVARQGCTTVADAAIQGVPSIEIKSDYTDIPSLGNLIDEEHLFHELSTEQVHMPVASDYVESHIIRQSSPSTDIASRIHDFIGIGRGLDMMPSINDSPSMNIKEIRQARVRYWLKEISLCIS